MAATPLKAVMNEIEQMFDAALFAPRTEQDEAEIIAWAKQISFRPGDLARIRLKAPRKPSIRQMIAAAAKAGATSITLPDGTVVQFGASDERNEWDTVLRHGTH
jgi:hypothetical protein